MALTEGIVLENRYRIDKLLSRGGMGAVYRGYDLILQIPIAIKENFFATPEAVAQFEQEALILARLHHPNLPRVSHHFRMGDQQYLVMDIIEGKDLRDILTERKTLDEKEALGFIIQICDAVSHMHAQSPPIIHRDIKPQNIAITPEGQAILIDFGIAKVFEDDSHTRTGARAITPGFSPPEQYGGVSGTTPQSDIYSLGATLYAVLTGKNPPDSLSLLTETREFTPPDSINPALSYHVSQAITHAMKPQPEDRPPSMSEWRRSLQAILSGAPQTQPRGEETTMVGRQPAGGWLVGPGGQGYPVKAGSLILGRSNLADIHLEDPRASRQHTRLDYNGQSYTVHDLGSANGTYINGQRLGAGSYPLKLGDRLTIGETTLVLSLSESVIEPSPQQIKAGVPLAAAQEHIPTAVVPGAAAPVTPPPPPATARQPVEPTVIPPQPAAAQQSPWLWVGLGAVLLGIVAGVIAIVVLVGDRGGVAPPDDGTQATLAALAATATEQASVGVTPDLGIEATLAALAAVATQQAQSTATPTPSDTATSEPSPTATQVVAQSKDQVSLPTATATPTPTSTATSIPPTATSQPTATATRIPTSTSIPPAPLGVFQNFERETVWQRGDQANGKFTRVSDQAYSGSFAGELSYSFPTSSNDFVVFLQSRRLAGEPAVISARVYGDSAGHFLNVWIRDANGQTWQMSFGQVKHNGWQEMDAIIDPDQPWPSGHISGLNNGQIEYPISFEAIVLDDGSDDYSGSGSIYIDDLTSREATVQVSTATPTRQPTAGPAATPTPGSSLYELAVAGQHRYETWGAPIDGDICNSYRNNSFNDKIHMKGFNLELSLTNNSTVKVADNWTPDFTTAQGKSVQACYYGYTGSGPQPGATAFVTFFTIVEPDDYVRVVQLKLNGQTLQICLDPGGAQTGC